MPVSDALVVGEDWISEHYFTTDAKRESFTERVLVRRKEWDAEEKSTRGRFVEGRSLLESRLVELAELGIDVDATTADGQVQSAPQTLDGAQIDQVRDLYDQITRILGYRIGQFTRVPDGPIEFVTSANLESGKPLAILAARPAATIEGLIDKHAPTLLTAWERDDEEPIHSVSTALSTLMTEVDGPDFALVVAGRWCLIAERERWPEGRWLAVDLQLVCERNDTKRGGEVDRALTCLDAASLAPDPSGDTWWTATLDAAVKHTVGVSKDLQAGVRDSIEIIANEVVTRRREQGLDPLPDSEAQPLAVQSLRYLYRILFLLYAEASPELQVLPAGAEEYDAGYGLDRLRDLALVELQTECARRGTHLYESLATLFRLVDRGHTPPADESLPEGLTFNALRADLFRPEATAHIDEVCLGNEAMLQVLQKLLLSKEEGKKQRGFISYVELGINQLGAVYEGLMSWTGSFAHEDLYEVAPHGDRTDGSWVVPIAVSGHLDEKDFVREVDPDTGEEKAVVHRRGSFVYRLSGRDRQRSASYYTPEVLTKFTVQQALEELLDQDDRRTTADEILQLTVCEPALGSGAFAIEAVRQLAEEYISRREEELGERIDPEQRPAEVQKVKAYLALHQVYGVDLNATAVELAEVSLWLDTMVAGLQAPWFGLRLRRGNSLVGARRQVYPVHKVKDKSWLKTPANDIALSALSEAVGGASPGLDTARPGGSPTRPSDGGDAEPTAEGEVVDAGSAEKEQENVTTGWSSAGERSDAGVSRPGDARTKPATIGTGVHHFLLPAQGWGSAVEVPKAVRDLVDPARLKQLKAWRREIRKKPTNAQLKRLQQLAQRVEVLWEISLRRLTIAEAESGRQIRLWGQDGTEDAALDTAHDGPVAVTREQIEVSLADEGSAYRRLRRVMDAWCALWFWPLTEMEVEPPSLDDWITACEKLIGVPPDRKRAWMDTFAAGADWDELSRAEETDLQFAGAQTIQRVLEQHPWLQVCEQVAAEQGFFHWELDFATVFARGGFDLQVGNPPWVRPVVKEEALLAEIDPWWAIAQKPSEPEKVARRQVNLVRTEQASVIIDGGAEVTSVSEFLGDNAQYSITSGHTDLYRAFMAQAWSHCAKAGISALIHYDTHFTDDKSGHLRAITYRRLRRHWQFVNELRLFDIGHQKVYAVNVYGPEQDVYFLHGTSLYHPDTVRRSLQHDGFGPEPGFKDDDGNWDQRPHQSRIQTVNENTLRLWQDILGATEWPETPMAYVVNSAATRALSALSESPRMKVLKFEFSRGWSESGDEKRGLIRPHWGEAEWVDAILQGPHIYVSRPLYKAVNPTMRSKGDWTETDLDTLDEDALPITAFMPADDRSAYDASYGYWESGKAPARDFYRVAWRRRAANSGERTLLSAIIPPGSTHVDGVMSAWTGDVRTFLAVQSVLGSLLGDFFVRSSPKSDIRASEIYRQPMVSIDHALLDSLIFRTLRLNCITNAYARLWRSAWRDDFSYDEPILARLDERRVGSAWTSDTPLRRAVDRRNAEVEIDALVAIMLDVSADELCTVYRTQFGVLVSNDHARVGAKRPNVFDARGRRVPNSVLSVWRKKGDAIGEEERTATHPGSGIDYTYELPFATRDREADFRTAYAEFERRLAEKEEQK